MLRAFARGEAGLARGIQIEMLGEARHERQRRIVRGRIQDVGRPEEITDTVIWLLSSESSFLTGQAISIDGGTTAGVQAGGVGS